MKTLNMFSWHLMVKYFLSIILLVTIGCEKNDGQEYIPIDQKVDDSSWVGFMEDLSFESIILVENKDNLNDAMQQVAEGDLVFYEEDSAGEIDNLFSTEEPLLAVSELDDEQIAIKDVSSRADKRKGSYSGGCRILEIKRSELSGDIAHYQILVRMGNGPHDVVRIHRLVRERKRYRPIKTAGNVFMVHGSTQDFDDIFFRPGVDTPNEQNSLPFFLASQNIDVWGIDLGWTLVPLETTDFSFFEDWGTTKDTGHVMKSMAIARLVRGLSRQGFGRMNLLGFSYGGILAYTAAFKETQQHGIFNNIKGLIPTDWGMIYAPEDDEYRQNGCDVAKATKENYMNGIYHNSNGVAFAAVGGAALSDPTGDSPFAPGFTNYQFALLAASQPSATPQAPFWHFFGGEYDGQTPTGLLYTDPERTFKLLANLAPHQPTYPTVEGIIMFCEENVAAIDEQLARIRIPIFYIGAAGGLGEQGVYTTTRTSSTDISIHIASKQPPELRAIDYGHADIFMAYDASEMVWEPLRDWLLDHK